LSLPHSDARGDYGGNNSQPIGKFLFHGS
jgi:hypothetical protein